MTTEKKIAQLRDRWLSIQSDDFTDQLERWCESPIEQLFLAALRTHGDGLMGFPHRTRWLEIYTWASTVHGVDRASRILTCADEDGEHPDVVVVQANVPFESGAYRVDFAFLNRTHRIAVELDGHDFHERTKEQAKRDKSRDRRLTGLGWTVIRFTGSEVYADPMSCVEQVVELQSSLFARARTAERGRSGR